VPDQPPHIGPPQRQEDLHLQRERFETPELATVLSHYDLGVIERIRSFPRGSRRAPKVLINSRKGRFLLKRRAPGRDDPYRVAFAHELQLHLAKFNYPVPRLIGTRDNNSLLQFNNRIYEMFEFVAGAHFDLTHQQAEQSGEALGSLHRLLDSHQPSYQSPVGTYHAAPGIDAKFRQVVAAVMVAEPTIDEQELRARCDHLAHAYHEAAAKADQAGYSQFPRVIVHGDWHPGNLLYRDGRVVAVLDFDSARHDPRVCDVANAVLQFTMKMDRPDDPDTWPEGLDSRRLQRLVSGYHQKLVQPLTRRELESLPWLMIEALIVESVVPIAATGSFARIPASAFLAMVERNVRWIAPRAGSMVRFLEG
jgi:homoserine kinase type II